MAPVVMPASSASRPGRGLALAGDQLQAQEIGGVEAQALGNGLVEDDRVGVEGPRQERRQARGVIGA